jgi:hypothetical protein
LKKNFTPLTLVKISQLYEEAVFIALSRSFLSSTSAILIDGYSKASPPRDSIAFERSEACSLALVTRILCQKMVSFQTNLIFL